MTGTGTVTSGEKLQERWGLSTGFLWFVVAVVVTVGATKLFGLASHPENFALWGLPIWTMYVAGLWEAIAGLSLLARRARPSAAGGLALTFLAASLLHARAAQWHLLSGPVILMFVFALMYVNSRQDGLGPTRPIAAGVSH